MKRDAADTTFPAAAGAEPAVCRQTIDFLGIRVDVLDTGGLCDRVLALARQEGPHRVMYVNADCMLIARHNRAYRQALNRADLVYADGIGVVWGARLWGHDLPGRSTGADFMPAFCRVFAGHGIRLFLLGAREGVADAAARRLVAQAPGLQVVGTHHGYFRPDESEKIVEQVNRLRPHILLVGMGAPCQELWIERYSESLRVPVLWGVGGLFDFLSGRTRRGPQWLLDHGFEWLCRLLVEPRRLWRRYLIGNMQFVYYILRQRYLARDRDG
ncbi:MAG TPA: glycosyltransferase [Desulfobulbus sp.]|nr:glycosyltransferase [Desulfobulbus sp.]